MKRGHFAWLLLALTACGSGDDAGAVPAAGGLPGPFAAREYLQEHVEQEQQRALEREARLQEVLRRNGR